jgi:V/A-type H+-transporting ATPase subunit D
VAAGCAVADLPPKFSISYSPGRAAEIQRTSRRLNALDHLLIPELEAERDVIQMALDEQERTDHFRFKLMKRILEKKRQG